MPSTTAYKHGDVVLVIYPFTDLTSTKQRPAVIVSADWFNRRSDGDVVLVAITSVVPSTISRDEFALTQADLTSAGLPKPSIVKVGKVFTGHKVLIKKRLGRMPDETLKNIIAKLKEILDA
jgi:mRNA interferase MazF